MSYDDFCSCVEIYVLLLIGYYLYLIDDMLLTYDEDKYLFFLMIAWYDGCCTRVEIADNANFTSVSIDVIPMHYC